MRNLLEYPITTEEKVDLLARLAAEFLAEGRIGDMRPLLLREIAKDVLSATRERDSSTGEGFRSDVPDVEEVIRYLRDFGPGTTDSTDLYFMRWAADHLCNLVSLAGFWRAQAALTAHPPPSPDAEPSAAGGA